MSVAEVIGRSRNLLIMFGVIFGLHGKEFISQWWATGSARAAWIGWVTHELPDVPVSLMIVIAAVGIGFVWELHDARAKQARWEERPEGYQPDRRDD